MTKDAIKKNLAIIEAATDPILVEQAKKDLKRLGHEAEEKPEEEATS